MRSAPTMARDTAASRRIPPLAWSRTRSAGLTTRSSPDTGQILAAPARQRLLDLWNIGRGKRRVKQGPPIRPGETGASLIRSGRQRTVFQRPTYTRCIAHSRRPDQRGRVTFMRRTAAFFGVALFLAAACAQPSPSGGGTSAAPAAVDQPQPGGRVVIGATGDPKTMQPVISTDTQSSGVWSWLYQGLTRANYKTGETEANFAEKFQLS